MKSVFFSSNFLLKSVILCRLDFADAWSSFNGDSTLDGFVTGFRLGARFVLDTFLSDDLPAGDE